LDEFVRSLRATWRTFLLRFALAFVVLALGWMVIAPAYAHMLATLGRPLIPVLETRPGTIYSVEGAKVYARRSIPDPGTRRTATFKFELWRGYASYDLILLAALILATPGWSLRQRSRLLGLGLGLLTLSEIAFFLVTVEYSQVRPLPAGAGSFLPASVSRPRQVLFTWLYYFFQIMGRGLFPLLVYLGMLGIAWGPPARPAPDSTLPGNAPLER
jgi:hypothetical protein